jgi:hypothetical protein
MMNQKTVIYIILSAILLYLYSKRGGIILFAAFAVVTAGTLFAGAGAGAREGMGLGGGKGGGGDKECAKMGFKPIKLDKDDLVGSLEKVMKNIETVAEKQWPFEKGDIEGKRTEDKAFEESWKIIQESSVVKEVLKKGRDDPDMVSLLTIFDPITEIYGIFVGKNPKTTTAKNEAITKYNTSALDEMIKSGSTVIKLLERIKKSDEIKDGGAKVQKIMTYIMCLVKHWISIFKEMRKVTGGGGGGKDEGDDDGGKDGDDDGEKKKKKKKKTTKKKDDEGDAGDD